MKLFFTAIFLCLIMCKAQAQDRFTIGLSFAPELTGQHSSTFKIEKVKPNLGYSTAVEANYFFGKNIGVFGRFGFFHKEMKVLINKDVARVNDPTDSTFQQLITTGFNQKESENYLEPAAGIVFRTTPGKCGFYLSLGTSMTMLLNMYEPLFNKTMDRSELSSNGYHTSFWNGLSGFGFNYYLGDRWKLQAEASMRYAFTNMITAKEYNNFGTPSPYNAHQKTYALGLKVSVIYILKHFKS